MTLELQSSFTSADLQQMSRLGMEVSQVEAQLARLKTGFPPIHLQRACTLGDGILSFALAQWEFYAKIYEEKIQQPGRAMKFVPASGAASRMFQDLLQLRQALRESDEISLEAEKNLRFFSALPSFPFYSTLDGKLSDQGLSLQSCIQQKKYLIILDALLGSDGLDYAALPKALIPFHRYFAEARTALEEQCIEAQDYLLDRRQSCRLHFTVPEEFLEKIKLFTQAFLNKPSCRTVDYQIHFSVQNPATHSLAVGLDGLPLRQNDGSLIFRPAGHGALLQNLEVLQGDIVFIKNIDNVISESQRTIHSLYKKGLGGILSFLQERIFAHLQLLQETDLSEDLVDGMFLDLTAYFPDLAKLKFENLEEKKQYLKQRLHRPLRVCGMVRNAGKPGGGPFWVEMGSSALPQIVESAQINLARPQQKEIFARATHFNPVDIVCALRDFRGKPFHLADYADPDAGLIVEKSEAGVPLLAIELPGLWNGGMAYWNSIFVEVPQETFCPVKTLWDLQES